jgi:recombination protein RecR
MNFPSKLIEDAVNAFASLPGIGKKTALRLTLNLLKREEYEVTAFVNSLQKMKANVGYCKSCNNISDSEECDICKNKQRNHQLICIVADFRDVIAVESTNQFRGVYHVLGGLISPMDGIGPNDLNLENLVDRITKNEATEILLALATTVEGDTTNFYIYRKLKDVNIKISTIARGMAVGEDLEYTDEITLGRSILNRVPFENTFSSK